MVERFSLRTGCALVLLTVFQLSFTATAQSATVSSAGVGEAVTVEEPHRLQAEADGESIAGVVDQCVAQGLKAACDQAISSFKAIAVSDDSVAVSAMIGTLSAQRDPLVRRSFWRVVLDLQGESAAQAVADTFLDGKADGHFGQLLRRRFGEIATAKQAEVVLKAYLGSDDFRSRRAYNLIKELKADLFLPLLLEYHNRAAPSDKSRQLFLRIASHNSLVAYQTAVSALSSEELADDELSFYVKAARLIKSVEAYQQIIFDAQYAARPVRLMAYSLLSNYPTDDALQIVTQARGGQKTGAADSLDSAVLEYSFRTLSQAARVGPADLPEKTGNEAASGTAAQLLDSIPFARNLSNPQLALLYRPVIKLSDGGFIGVNLKKDGHPYTDFIPMDIFDLNSNAARIPLLTLANNAGTRELSDPVITRLGFHDSGSLSDFIDFEPLWDGIWTLEKAYRSLTHDPTTYFRVFHEPTKRYPYAIQYWFYYFFNDWSFDHFGDWESITIFLDEGQDPREVVYSTHLEAHRHSWVDVDLEVSRPSVYVSNGGHGSYVNSGTTDYSLVNFTDDHIGGEEWLLALDLVDLEPLQNNVDSWFWFSGHWGDISGQWNPAPHGPVFRQDASNATDWGRAENAPYTPACAERQSGARVFGDQANPGPWHWAEAYRLNWEKGDTCLAGVTNIAGSTEDQSTLLTWDHVNGAGGYELVVHRTSDSSYILGVSLEASLICRADCSFRINSLPSETEFRVWIRAVNTEVKAPWSNPYRFSTGLGKATLVSPSGSVLDTTPTYTWNALSSATWYRLQVNDASGVAIKKWYSSAQSGCAGGSGTCSITPNTIVGGASEWWIQAWNQAGLGPWSDGLSFFAGQVRPDATVLVYPSGSLADTMPTYTWNAVSASTWYYLWVKDSSGVRIKQWYSAGQAGCASGSGTCSVTPAATLKSGAGEWWVRTWNAAGVGPWSSSLSFTNDITRPPAATLIAPSGDITDETPMYSWNAVSSSAGYYLWVDDSDGKRIGQWYTAAEVGCTSGTGTCSVTPTVVLALGAGSWWIRTWNSAGFGPWSTGNDFSVRSGTPPPPPPPPVQSPAG